MWNREFCDDAEIFLSYASMPQSRQDRYATFIFYPFVALVSFNYSSGISETVLLFSMRYHKNISIQPLKRCSHEPNYAFG